MTRITTRAGKGSPLTNAELDGNFTSLRDAVVAPASATYTYGTEGELIGVEETLPGGVRTTTYHYDASGELESVSAAYAGAASTTTYHYDADGELSGTTTTETGG